MTIQLTTIKLWIKQIIRARSINFFSAANIRMPQGGMLLDRKTDVYKILPTDKIPKTIVTSGGASMSDILEKLQRANISFPVFVKPDIGFRGYLAERIENKRELINYLSKYYRKEFLIQEFVSLENEYSLLFYKYPLSNKKGILSFVRREYPRIIGNGKSSIKELILKYNNKRISKRKILLNFSHRLNEIPEIGENITIDFIGNHIKGSEIIDIKEYITQELIDYFDKFIDKIGGLNFVRIDLKSDDLERLKKGEFVILEINGAKSESLHLYDETYNKEDRLRALKLHWKIFFEISNENLKISSYKSPTLFASFKSIFHLYRTIYFEDKFVVFANKLGLNSI